MKRNTKPGTWRQGILTAADQRILAIYMLWQSINRGTDYVRGSLGSGAEYDILSRAFSADFVGIWFITFAGLALAGMFVRSHVAVWMGHGCLALAYFLFFLAMSASILVHQDFSATRGPGLLLGATLLHAFFAVRTGPFPLRKNDGQHPIEGVSAPNEGDAR